MKDAWNGRYLHRRGYLDKVLEYEHGGTRIDYGLLAGVLAQGDEILRTYYYHCMPYQGRIPTEDEKGRHRSMQRFITALRRLPRFEVRLGRLAYRGEDHNGERIFVQKRVDTMLGVDMALLAAKGKITNAVVLSGDSDMVPAVEAVKSEGVRATLWHGNFGAQSKPSRELYSACDDRNLITAELIDRVRR